MHFKLIVANVKPDYSDKVVVAAKAAGATGATIISGRGTGVHEAKTFFGLTLEARTDVILFLVNESMVDPILEAISEAGKFKQPGTGIAFVLEVGQAIGLESQLQTMEHQS
jgi:nitrogen regulatory protein PII